MNLLTVKYYTKVEFFLFHPFKELFYDVANTIFQAHFLSPLTL
ncbi:hypothetical protein UF75_3568 [Desulfosporosinus sp. I2]|nr:hypothetical protein UF75_3568 [Desulfosporosinus sp. I2]